jgi:hypothetical protein
MKRVTIAGLAGFVCLVAAGLTSFGNHSSFGSSVAFTLALGGLLTAPIGAKLRHGEQRACWIGFALFGWTYFAFCFFSIFNNIEAITPSYILTNEIASSTTSIFQGVERNVKDIRVSLHSLCCIVFAWIGSLIAGSMARSQH